MSAVVANGIISRRRTGEVKLQPLAICVENYAYIIVCVTYGLLVAQLDREP